MAEMVQTYRVLKEIKVGDSVRQYGDLAPEAFTFPNVRTYESAGFLEKVWVPQSELDAHLEKFPPATVEETAVEENTTPKNSSRKTKKIVRKKGKKNVEAVEGVGAGDAEGDSDSADHGVGEQGPELRESEV